jgi:hypothetical protein
MAIMWAYSRQNCCEQSSNQRRTMFRCWGTGAHSSQCTASGRLYCPVAVIVGYADLPTPSTRASGLFSLSSSLTSGWENTMAVPLNNLLAMAKARDITKVVLRGSTLAYYLHSTQSLSSSLTLTSSSSLEEPKMEQLQRWSKTILNGGSASLDGLIPTLLERGCDDIQHCPNLGYSNSLTGQPL